MKRVALQKLGGSVWTYDTNILHLSNICFLMEDYESSVITYILAWTVYEY